MTQTTNVNTFIQSYIYRFLKLNTIVWHTCFPVSQRAYRCDSPGQVWRPTEKKHSPVNDADDVYDPEHRPEHEDEDGKEDFEQLSIQHGATAAADADAAAEDAVLATATEAPDATQL